MKKCTICGENRPRSAFNISRGTILRGECKECGREKLREYRARTREKRIEYSRRYHQEHRDEILARKRAYDAQHRERAAEYYLRNKEHIRELERGRYVRSPGMAKVASLPHVVYRFFDSNGILLYVGLTYDFDRRLGEHRRYRPWFERVDSWELHEYADRTTAKRAESRAILSESPVFNISEKGSPEVKTTTE